MLRLKKKLKKLPSEPIAYPVGSAVKTEAGYFYIKSNSIRMRIPTERILHSWNFHRLITTTEAALKNYKIIGKLGFRSGSLLHNVADGRIYLVSENKLRHITSPEAFDTIGAVYDDAVTVSNDEIKLHEAGGDLN